MNKVFIVIGIIILAAIGGFVVFQNSASPQNNTGSNSNPAQARHTITFTSAGYSPATLTINRGDTVAFQNDSSSQFWPASDQHPTHTAYSQFDPRRAIGPGESYEFTFERSGTWGYHDHLNPSFTGTIVVQ